MKERGIIMIFSGFFPAQQKDYSIYVSYIDESTLEEKIYVKGTFRCEYNLYGDKCDGNQCPIYKNAPEYQK